MSRKSVGRWCSTHHMMHKEGLGPYNRCFGGNKAGDVKSGESRYSQAVTMPQKPDQYSRGGQLLTAYGEPTDVAYRRDSYEGGGTGRVVPFSGAKDPVAYLRARAVTLTELETDERYGDASSLMPVGTPVPVDQNDPEAVESTVQGQRAGTAEHRFRRASAAAEDIPPSPDQDFPDTDDIMDVVVDIGDSRTVNVRKVTFDEGDSVYSQHRVYIGTSDEGRTIRFNPEMIQDHAPSRPA